MSILKIWNGSEWVEINAGEGSDVDSVNSLTGDIIVVGKGEVGVTVEGQNIVVSGTDHTAGGSGPDSPDIDSINTVTGTLTLGGADGITIVDETTDSDAPVLTASGFRTEFLNASGTLSTEIDSDITTHTAITNAHHTKSTLTKNISIELPTATEDIAWFKTPIAITITDMRAVLRGSATPSVTISGITHDPNRNLTGNNVLSSGVEITSITTGHRPPLEGDVTVPADSFVWIETSAQSGTVDEILVSVTYTED